MNQSPNPSWEPTAVLTYANGNLDEYANGSKSLMGANGRSNVMVTRL